MKSAPRTLLILSAFILLTQFSLSAQNDGYQKAGNGNSQRPANSGQRDDYATPGDMAPSNTNANARTEPVEENPLEAGNLEIGSGFGYVNSVTTIEIVSGSTIQKGGNTGYQLHVTPSIGYFIARNFVFGLGMDYLINSSQDNSDNTSAGKHTSDTKLLFGPYSRLYLPFAGDQAFFLGGAFGYGKSDTEISDGVQSQNAKTTLMTYGVGPGYAIFSNGRVSLETQVKYNFGFSRNVVRVDGADQSTRTRTKAWDFVVGLHFYFTRR